jgi:DNA-binding transcriptional regulator PaaX
MRNKRKIYYKGVSVNIYGLPMFSRSKKKQNKKIHKRVRSLYHVAFSSSFTKDAPKNLLIVYDIPEGRKKERDWFRRQLIKFEYVMIQKSVWVGPSPLPKDFVDYLKEIKIDDNFKTFKLAKSYNI